MYCVIQFYVQLREPLAEHKPFLKVLAIKLVIFLSFWQTIAISLATSTFNIVSPNAVLAYPDLKVGIPSLMLCVEMALFSILHLWAFPYAPYVENAKTSFYPVPDPSMGIPPRENEHGPKMGGFMGLKAFGDALNLWDVIKAFGRGIRWLFVGVKRRKQDPSYQTKAEDIDTSYPMKPYAAGQGNKGTDHLPIANEFRRSAFGLPQAPGEPVPEESAGLITNAQPNPASPPRGQPNPYRDQRQPQLYDPSPSVYMQYDDDRGDLGAAGRARYEYDPNEGYGYQGGSTAGWSEPQGPSRPGKRTSTQVHVGNALWGDRNMRGGAF